MKCHFLAHGETALGGPAAKLEATLGTYRENQALLPFIPPLDGLLAWRRTARSGSGQVNRRAENMIVPPQASIASRTPATECTNYLANAGYGQRR
jgi:hypothetical protein